MFQDKERKGRVRPFHGALFLFWVGAPAALFYILMHICLVIGSGRRLKVFNVLNF